MTNEEYLSVQTQLSVIGGVVAEIPLIDFLNMANRAESIGPILDPTLYREAGESLSQIIHLAESLIPFQREVFKIRRGENDA